MQLRRISVGICAYLFVVITSISSTPQARAQSEFFMFGGEICQTRNPAVRNIRRVQGALMNISESNTFNVSCPIFSKVQLPEDPETSFDLRVTLYFSNLNSIEQEIRCVFSKLVVPGKRNVKSVIVMNFPPGWTQYIEHVYEDFTYDDWLGLQRDPGMPHVSCTLPPQSKILNVQTLIDRGAYD